MCIYIYLNILNREITKYLIEVGGADVNLEDQLGRTPARIAKELAQIDIMNYLEEKMNNR